MIPLPDHALLPTAGLSFGLAPKQEFSPEVQRDGRWHAQTATGLQVETAIEQRGPVLVIRRWLRNAGSAATAPIDGVSPLTMAFDLPRTEWELLCAHGGTSEHFSPPSAFQTRRLFNLRNLRLSSHPQGRSSNQDLPLVIGLAPARKAGFFCGLEWSGHWFLNVWGTGRDLGIAAGVPLQGATLEPGETLALPAVHLGFFAGDLDAGSNALRRYLATSVCPPYRGKPVLPVVSYDSWFGLENRFTADILRKQVDRAAEAGVEVFVHDAAWFPGGFPAGVGNWQGTDPAKWPDGLEPFADYVRSKGLEFGLWFEIERAAPGTAALTRHPEMFLTAPPPTRNHGGVGGPQAHLNLARRDAQDWAIETIGSWIKRLDLRWSRWDYNIEPQPFWQAADPSGKIQFAYFEGLYRVLDTLMQEHPGWRIETCASGGRRIDLGTLRRAHVIWISDEVEIGLNCRRMQAGASRFLPSYLLNSSLPTWLAGGDPPQGRTAILNRMLGKLSFDGDIASWSPAFTAQAAELVRRFKAVRHLFAQDFHQLLPPPQEPEQPDAVQFSSHDGREHLVFAFAGSHPVEMAVPLRGLPPGSRWRIAPALADWHGGDLRIALPPHGAELWHLHMVR